MKMIDFSKIEFTREQDTELLCGDHVWSWNVYMGTVTIWLDRNQAFYSEKLLTRHQIKNIIQTFEIGFRLGKLDGKREAKANLREILGL